MNIHSKKSYLRLSARSVEMPQNGVILAGSIPVPVVSVEDVEVKEYEDGFADKSSFEELTFE